MTETNTPTPRELLAEAVNLEQRAANRRADARRLLKGQSLALTLDQQDTACNLYETCASRSAGADRARELSLEYPGFPFSYYAKMCSDVCNVRLYEKPSQMWRNPGEESSYDVYLCGEQVRTSDGEFFGDSWDSLHPWYRENYTQ